MCGRFTLILVADIVKQFSWLTLPEEWRPRYNIAPAQPILAAANDGKNTLSYWQWGLVPSWAKEASIGQRMINARAETLAERPAFRTALRRRRCLIPADGFYEWKKDGKLKRPMHVHLKDRRPFLLAGLWDIWQAPDGSQLPSCTIITTEPNELMKSIHDRMPVILRQEHHQQWLSPDEQPAEAMSKLLGPYPAEEMEATEVSRAVNNARTEGPECLQPPEGELWR